MKSTRKEPTFLLEMPQLIGHLIMKRGHLLRSGRTRTLACVGTGGPKSWLEARLIPSAGESADENWDKAHELAAKFKRELHRDVYVEPACEHGRFKEITSPQLPSELDGLEDFTPKGPGSAFDMGIGVGMDHSAAPGMGGFFGSGMGRPGGFSSHDPFSMGLKQNNGHIPGMLHIPDPLKDLLPPQVRQALGQGAGGTKAKPKRRELTFSALRELAGWSELSETKQKMFEVEAAQLEANGQHSGAGSNEMAQFTPVQDSTFDNERALASLSVNPRISAALKRFLLESFERATAQQGSTNSI